MEPRAHVLIIGGTKGLGKVITERFLSRGFKVSVLSRTKPASSALGGAINHFEVDLQRLVEADVPTLRHRIIDGGGPLAYLIFCQRYRGEDEAWSSEMTVTVGATDMLIRGFADSFDNAADHSIVVVSSVYAEFVGGSQPASYHVAKAGQNQLVRYYAWQLGKTGTRVNAVMPLTYLKPESREYYLSNVELMDLYSRFVPLKRMGTADDSANLIDFLCSDKSSFITGQAFYVDGGVSVIWPEQLARGLSGL